MTLPQHAVQSLASRFFARQSSLDDDQSNPAPRAHLYFAPRTSTGISVEYGYAGMLCAKRYSDASSTSTSPASDTTTGLSIPFPRISSTISASSFANTIGGVTIVSQ